MSGFGSTDSIVKADVDNMLRGLSIDNADSSHTGDTDETDLSTLSITADTIGSTGAIHVLAVGTITDSASAAKTIKLILGSTTLATISRTGANAQDWIFDVWIYNTSASTQRVSILKSTADAVTLDGDYTTSAENTAATLTLKVTGTLANGADTIGQTMFDVLVIQQS